MAEGRERLKAIACVLLLSAAMARPVAAQLPDPGRALLENPVLLEADAVIYTADRERVTARGNVQLAQDGRTLLTDEITYDLALGRVSAKGNIILIEATGEALFADALELDDRLSSGFVDGIRVLLPDRTRLAAVKGVRSDANRTVLDRAVYSPCEVCAADDEPLWQIKAERVVHDQTTGTVAYRNARLEVLGVPVVATPYFYHPDPTVQRRTGFLAPSFGSDTELGLTVETPFYIELAPNRDVTLSPKFTTNAGILLGSEVRDLQVFGLTELGGAITYTDAARSRDAAGQARESGGDEVRGHVFGRGRYAWNETERAGFDLALASDNTFLRRYDIDNEDVLENHVFLERYGDRDYIGLNAFAFQSLREDENQDEIPFVLPLAEAHLFGGRDRFGGYFDLRSSVLALTRRDGLDTRRVSSEVGWQLPHIGANGDVWSLRLALRGDLYNTEGNAVTRGDDGDSNTTGRIVPTARVDWGLPLVGESGHWNHVIEPRLAFTFTPGNLNSRRIPNEDSLVFEFDETNLFEASRFTGIDRPESGAMLAYGLRFDSLGPDAWRVAGLIGQSVRSGPDGLYPEGSGLEDSLSDIVGRLEVRPSELLDLGYRFRLDKNSLAVRRSDLTLAFGPPRLRFDLQHLFLSDDLPDQDLRRRQELVAGVRLQVLDSLAVGVRTRRDLEEDRTVTTQYGLVYNNPCLVLVAGLEQNFTRKGELEDELRFTIRLAFRGLGDLEAASDMF